MRRLLLVLGVSIALPLGSADAHCSESLVCPGGGSSCTVSTTHFIDNGCSLEFPGVTLVIASNGKLQTASNGHSFSLSADSITVRGTLQALQGAITADATAASPAGFFTTESISNSPGKIDVRGGGSVKITAHTTASLLGQEVNADGDTTLKNGGHIVVIADDIVTTGSVHADGNNAGHGGAIELVAADDVTLEGTTTANADGGGSLPLQGGRIYVEAGDDVSVAGNILAKGARDGDGGAVDMEIAGTATLDGNITVNGVGGSGGASGGTISVEAADVTSTGDWLAVGNAGGPGGIVTVVANAGNVVIASTGTIDASGGGTGGGTGGFVSLRASDDVTANGDVSANGGGTGSAGGEIELIAEDGDVSVSSALEAQSTSSNGDRNGSIFIHGCAVSVSGLLRTRGQVGGGGNTIEYITTFTASGGTLQADGTNEDGANVVNCRCVDTSPADGTCDSPITCTSAPSLGGAAEVTPSATTDPIPSDACS